MGLVLSPEIKMARRIIAKHSLKVPFDLYGLVSQYARITYKHFPDDDVDGICLFLKTAGKSPKIILNANLPQTRQRFTLAHELGHIIIPWHCGNIIDETEDEEHRSNSAATMEYWRYEREANRFASEVLMPFDWIFGLYKANPDKAFLRSQICLHCNVSDIAAGIRIENVINEIEQILVPTETVNMEYESLLDLSLVQDKIVRDTKLSSARVAQLMMRNFPVKAAYCIERNNIVVASGGAKDSHVAFQWLGDEFVAAPYPYYQKYSVYELDGTRTHWWILEKKFSIKNDDRNWREILDGIANEIHPLVGINQFKTTVNAKLSGAFGNWKRKNPELGIDNFIEDAVLRFNNLEYEDFVKHRDFLGFIKRRAEALFK